jgi:hypothetical protein
MKNAPSQGNMNRMTQGILYVPKKTHPGKGGNNKN